MDYKDLTLGYYEENAEAFVQNTMTVEFSEMQERFVSHVKPGGLILDLGCGSGRDSKAFLERGFRVVAVDGSPELCRYAEEVIGQPVICATFQEYEPSEAFDGIWACASLLHLPYAEIVPVLKKLVKHLASDGCFYLSFKYGEYEGVRNGRYFTDMTENRFAALLNAVPELTLMDQFITTDARPDREEKWWNGMVRITENARP